MTDASQQNVDQLVAELGSEDAVERRSAREALVQVGSTAVPPLLDALEAPRQHVRWEAVKPLLTTLMKADLPDGVYPGAHHVLHDLVKRPELAPLLEPVLKAFDEPEPEIAVPPAAAEALKGKIG